MTAEDERKALEWLDNWDVEPVVDQLHNCHGPIATLKRLLAEPRMPARPVVDCYPETEGHTMPEWDAVVDAISHYHRALYAHLTKPATKTVEVWRVEYAEIDACYPRPGDSFTPKMAQFFARESALKFAYEKFRNGAACVEISGPHKQTVPA